MPSELISAIEQICNEKKIPMDSVIATIESALAAAYRKDFGEKNQNIKVKFDLETGGFQVTDVKEVVEDELKEVYEKIKEEKIQLAAENKELSNKENFTSSETDDGEEIKRFNPKTMIAISEARETKENAELGDEIIKELIVPGDFGRMAAQTAKQVIIQKLREAERTTVFKHYQNKIGEIVNGTIQRREGGVFLVELNDITAIMPLSEIIPTEKYASGQNFKFFVKTVEQGTRGPEIVLSRAHPEMLRKIFKLEVPEIATGTVQIKNIAREAGFRSKIAVMAKEDNIDPIGSCVGQRGTRVQTIINEMGGEKIDIIEWDDDPIKFIAKALSPAKIIKVEIKESNTEAKEARVYVQSDQFSLAIGKEGQNVRLAAKLTGWKIDIAEMKTEEDKNQEAIINSQHESEKQDNANAEQEKEKIIKPKMKTTGKINN